MWVTLCWLPALAMGHPPHPTTRQTTKSQPTAFLHLNKEHLTVVFLFSRPHLARHDVQN